MSEAYECDRCGALETGSPKGAMMKGDGLSRERMKEERHAPSITQWDFQDVQDLCEECKNQLDRWYQQEAKFR